MKSTLAATLCTVAFAQYDSENDFNDNKHIMHQIKHCEASQSGNGDRNSELIAICYNTLYLRSKMASMCVGNASVATKEAKSTIKGDENALTDALLKIEGDKRECLAEIKMRGSKDSAMNLIVSTTLMTASAIAYIW